MICLSDDLELVSSTCDNGQQSSKNNDLGDYIKEIYHLDDKQEVMSGCYFLDIVMSIVMGSELKTVILYQLQNLFEVMHNMAEFHSNKGIREYVFVRKVFDPGICGLNIISLIRLL